MKILILQLARPGDIFCTAPTLQALAREYPGAELHLCIRKKFANAAKLIRTVSHFWELDSEVWLGPLLEDSTDFSKSIYALSQLVNDLKIQKFDQIINLTFSPSSSFLTHMIADKNTLIRGYSRTSDFYLHIPDEAGIYFRSHVGFLRGNRIHVVDLMALVAGATLKSSDLDIFSFQRRSGEAIVCHMGASQEFRTWPISHWEKLFSKVIQDGHKIQLVGGAEDDERAQYIMEQLGKMGPGVIENWVGKTSFQDLAHLTSQAKVFIGGDSGPSHLASGVGCPVLSLNLKSLCFWETGPFSKGSRVLISEGSTYDLNPEEVYSQLQKMLNNEMPNTPVPVCDGQPGIRYDFKGDSQDKRWDWIAFMTFGSPIPERSETEIIIFKAAILLCEKAEDLILKFIDEEFNQEFNRELIKTDQSLQVLGRQSQNLMPIFSKFFCEKENIPPGPTANVAENTLGVYKKFKQQIMTYIPQNRSSTERIMQL